MERYKRKYIKNGVIIPAVIAVAMTALFFIVLNIVSGGFPFVKDTVEVASYEKAEILQADKVDISGNIVKRSDAEISQSNTVFGSITIAQKEYPLIYDANEVNAMGKFNMQGNSTVIGDTGSAFLSCYKSDSAQLKALKTGDEINIQTHYGSFVYRVDYTKYVLPSTLDSVADGVGKALVLYTDGSRGVGMGGNYFCAVCHKASGTEVVQ